MTGARTGVTERELAVLRWVGEQYAVPMVLLAELVEREHQVPAASAPRLARRMASRLCQLGYAARPHAVGRWWLVPTRAGLQAAGLTYRAWKLDRHEWSLTHLVATARLRLHLAAAYPDAHWESQRAIDARWALQGARVRHADGGLHWPDGGAVLDQDPAWTDGVWWFTTAPQVALLTIRLREAGGGDRHQVYPLPEEVAL